MNIAISKLITLGKTCNEILKEKRLGAYLGYKVNSIVEIAEQKEKFFGDEMTRIIEDYAQKDDQGQPKRSKDGDSILIIDGKQNECHQKIYELETLEVEWQPPSISLDELDKMDLTFEEQKLFFPFVTIEE